MATWEQKNDLYYVHINLSHPLSIQYIGRQITVNRTVNLNDCVVTSTFKDNLERISNAYTVYNQQSVTGDNDPK